MLPIVTRLIRGGDERRREQKKLTKQKKTGCCAYWQAVISSIWQLCEEGMRREHSACHCNACMYAKWLRSMRGFIEIRVSEWALWWLGLDEQKYWTHELDTVQFGQANCSLEGPVGRLVTRQELCSCLCRGEHEDVWRFTVKRAGRECEMWSRDGGVLAQQ